jgi:hypothetical protein
MEQYTLVLNKALMQQSHVLQHYLIQDMTWQRLLYVHLEAEVLYSTNVILREVQKLFGCTAYLNSGCIRKEENSSINFRMLLFRIQNIIKCS